ncbi:MAG: TRAP transporter small permease subunit [Candidatus Binatia bacterium]
MSTRDINETEAIKGSTLTRFGRAVALMNSLSGLVLFFMMFLITFDVAGRYLLSEPITGTLEITEFLMVFVIFLSISCVQQRKGHIRVQILTRRLPPKAEIAVDILAHLVALLFFLLIAWQSGASALSSWEFREASEGLLQIPIYPPKFAISLGSLLMGGQILSDILSRLRLLSAER